MNIYTSGSTKYIEKFIIFDFVLCLYSQIICDFFPFISFIKIIPDFFNILILSKIFFTNAIHHFRFNKHNISAYLLCLFLLYASFSFFISNGAIIAGMIRYRYILWGCLIYYCVSNYLDIHSVKHIFNYLYYSIYVHAALILFQFFVLRTSVDTTNGIFGMIDHNNAAQGIYCLVLSLYGFSTYLFKCCEKYKSIIMVILPCITCALAEIKAFYILFILGAIIISAYALNTSSRFYRFIKIFAISCIGLILSYLILSVIMPDNLYAFTSLDKYITYESWETDRAGGYGRLSQIQWIISNLMNNDIISSIFGIGICNSNSILVYELGKSFYNFGFVGLLFLLLFFTLNGISVFLKKEKSAIRGLCISISFIEIICLLIWNCTLNRMVYIVFFILAIGYLTPEHHRVVKHQ